VRILVTKVAGATSNKNGLVLIVSEHKKMNSAAAVHRVGKPIQNAFIESFNSRLRDESLNEQVFLSLDDALRKIESSGAVGTIASGRIRVSAYLVPEEFAASHHHLGSEPTWTNASEDLQLQYFAIVVALWDRRGFSRQNFPVPAVELRGAALA
jgi:hypothetical protein